MPPARRAGFTLLEILVVLMIIGILASYLVVNVPTWIDRANMTACEQNMRRVWQYMTAYRTDHNGQLPRDEGQRFFLRLWKDKLVDHTESNAKMFFCPSEGWGTVYLDQEEMFAALDDWENVGPGTTTYAGFNSGGDRELRRRMRQGDGNVVILADAGLTHKTGIIYLTADGVTHRLTRAEIMERLGYDPWDQGGGIGLGPGAELEELRTVTND